MNQSKKNLNQSGFSPFRNQKFLTGFTLTEIIISLTLFVLILVIVFSIYALHQRVYTAGEARAEVLQNGRVVLERMTREVRQARDIVTELADDESGATSTILFEDGHDVSTIHYIHFFQDNKNIKREVIAYYFSGDPYTYVVWNATPPPGQEKLTTTTEAAQIIGEYVTRLDIWGSPTVNVSTTLEKGDQKINLKTKILGRNL
jgi:type II secretory pathway pseudopilin PulG